MYSRQIRAVARSAAATAASQFGLEVSHPGTQRAGVVLAQRLRVAHLEAGPLHRQHRVADIDQFAVGEHVAPDERVATQLRAADRRDGVVQQPPRRPQHRVQDAEVLVEPLGADVLRHADRADGVERLAPDLAVVEQADVDPVVDPGGLDPLPSQLRLGTADGDADNVGVVRRGCVDRHRAPSAADVEQTHPRPGIEAELAGHHVVLGLLCLLQRGGVIDEARTRVRHRRPEHDAVELVADVVVVRDGIGVPAQAVTPAPEAGLLRWRRQRPADHAEPAGRREPLTGDHRRRLRVAGMTSRSASIIGTISPSASMSPAT